MSFSADARNKLKLANHLLATDRQISLIEHAANGRIRYEVLVGQASISMGRWLEAAEAELVIEGVLAGVSLGFSEGIRRERAVKG